MVDLMFVVDNSPSMDAKQRALAKNFPEMIAALEKMEGGLPDIRIGVISSDFGAGQGEAGGNCSGSLGNQGILWGNDPTVNPEFDRNKFATISNIQNGCGMSSGARWIQDIQLPNSRDRQRNYTGNLTDVFSCLAKSVGVGGCGYEHTLQSLRVALTPIVKNPSDRFSVDINPQNVGFLRQKAYLGIVIVSDEDDCSADPNSGPEGNNGMFLPRLINETASLRCAARGHVCNGQPIPNYTKDSGYTGSTPFEANFSDCDAKDDTNRDNLPLIRVRDFIESVKATKERPDDQILVAGIIGWPKDGATGGLKYRIGKDSTSMPVEQQKLWDYMPICTLPNERSDDGNIYKAYGAFRLKKFIDGFHGQTYSICDMDNFKDAMQMFGEAVVKRLRPACVNYPLVDTDPNIPQIQPECKVVDMVSCDSPGSGVCHMAGFEETPIPECINPTTGAPLTPSNPEKAQVGEANRPCWYLVYDKNPDTGCPNAPNGQRISALRVADGVAPVGTLLSLSCRTCTGLDDPACASQ
jgi:hypothetical protein